MIIWNDQLYVEQYGIVEISKEGKLMVSPFVVVVLIFKFIQKLRFPSSTHVSKQE